MTSIQILLEAILFELKKTRLPSKTDAVIKSEIKSLLDQKG